MRRLHLIFGLLVVLVFLLTGQYMDRYHQHLHGVPDGVRMLYRSRHIYILLAGLLNLGIGAYFAYRQQRWRKRLQTVGSVLLLLASLLFIAAFFYEPTWKDLDASLTRFGVYAIVAGTLLHLLSGAERKKDAMLN